MSEAPRARKSLGQHFLHDSGIATRIVDLLHITPEDRVLEIGPGAGALTCKILARGPAFFRLIEKDDYWADYHATRLMHQPQTDVVHTDGLLYPWEGLSGPWKIISNLPYNVGSVLLWDIVFRVPCLVRGVFMVQKEVGERLCARPGTQAYGALSAWVQSYVCVEWAFVVGPGAFNPRPKVDSAVLALASLPTGERPRQPHALAALLKLCFQMRRKQLQVILKRAGYAQIVDCLHNLGIAPEARPESLSPRLFQALAAALPQKDG